ncbi:disulfide bond formation protein B [Marinobacter caseinilyticus]|uniref:disulfide bond formation protein B n=1 Tax=Marinobacter caseinilyticus TaxID=2692195 RepID=UPI00140E40D9|nr:disulfide bond formation protein B [Marinobacter caseinilyticus]
MNRRTVFAFVFLLCAALLAVAFYMEYVMGLEPCPLCWLQRYAFMAIGLVSLVAALHNPTGIGGRVYGGVLALCSLAGLGLAGRQLWLQSLPEDQVPACGPSVEYLLEVFPLLEVLKTAVRGTGDCAEVLWRFMGLSIAGWTAVFFTLVIVVGVMLMSGVFRSPGR